MTSAHGLTLEAALRCWERCEHKLQDGRSADVVQMIEKMNLRKYLLLRQIFFTIALTSLNNNDKTAPLGQWNHASPWDSCGFTVGWGPWLLWCFTSIHGICFRLYIVSNAFTRKVLLNENILITILLQSTSPTGFLKAVSCNPKICPQMWPLNKMYLLSTSCVVNK